ncbi:hypothetical protein [Bradyrhizobium sp. JYMT SZCCT0428]|uniref:hypothetical protein n=1 Tax=Bradyrhizobium sp. JYMT SZCCT0428 TaxID=2807673 RepID=UPI001BABDB0A|nr:hypothetical protein [Bradyrhizobium sp. JYMT SZCCT0428]MBR1155641.1 hypothetical protein [Bradyrhizobium sp. JYMT SZCCT0428]
MGTFGGYQPNAGRKKGGINARTAALRNIADEALAAGITPLEVMLQNMRFYHSEAETILAELLKRLAEGEAKPEQLISAMKELGSFKEKAQRCAVDAAPFLHPHLSAVSVNANIKVDRNLLIEDGMDVDQAASLYLATVNDPEMLLLADGSLPVGEDIVDGARGGATPDEHIRE